MYPAQRIEFYRERAESFGHRAAELDKQISFIAFWRLMVFVLGITAVILMARAGLPWQACVGMGIAAAAIFLVLVRRHARLFDTREEVRHLLKINAEEAEIGRGILEGRDGGNEFRDGDHPYSSDLDIFGPESLFAYLNRTGTHGGRNRLADWLSYHASSEKIIARQKAAAALQPETEWRQRWQAAGRMAEEKETDVPQLLAWVQDKPLLLRNPLALVLRFALPAVMAVVIVLAVLERIPATMIMNLMVVNVIAAGLFMKAINRRHTEAGHKQKLLEKYSRLIALLESQKGRDGLLTDIHAGLQSGGEAASHRLRKLASILDVLDSRANLIGYIITNGLYLRDLHAVARLESWMEKCRTAMPAWMEAIAATDALQSISTFAFNQVEPYWPVPLDSEEMELEATALAHPFLAPEKRIGNTVAVKGWAQFLLITGSNMAGKSTFLRAVGINMILAMAGAPVCAASFRFRPVQIFTSMRIGDSIRQAESTFYAELKRLKAILDRLNRGEHLFILLDEILRGTNSADKLTGSFALVRQLLALQGTGLIATHDLPLAQLEQEYPGQVHNCNFEVQIKDGRFYFDYRLRPGVCRTLNATELMQQMGIEVAVEK